MSGVVVALAHAHDVGASRVAARLETVLGSDAVTVVRPEALGLAAWSHTLSARGDPRTTVRLPGGVAIGSENVNAVFNRLQYLPVPRFHAASQKDRDYAGAELQALVASWLLSFGDRAVNPAGPRGLSRGPVSRRGWLALAARAGLPVVLSARATAGRMLPPPTAGQQIDGPAWPGGARGPAPAELGVNTRALGSVLVVGDEALGSLASRFGSEGVALARLAECALLEVRFAETPDGPAVCDVNALPPLLEDWEAEAVVRLIRRKRRRYWEGRRDVGPPGGSGRLERSAPDGVTA